VPLPIGGLTDGADADYAALPVDRGEVLSPSVNPGSQNLPPRGIPEVDPMLIRLLDKKPLSP
jgi:hypothetical protein